jgi:hypothetical protein
LPLARIHVDLPLGLSAFVSIKFLAAIIKLACPATLPSRAEAQKWEAMMNKLTKIAVWGSAYCAVLLGSVILIYGVPLEGGGVSDIVLLQLALEAKRIGARQKVSLQMITNFAPMHSCKQFSFALLHEGTLLASGARPEVTDRRAARRRRSIRNEMP